MTTFSDLAEHTGTLVALLGTLIGVCGLLIGIVYKVMMSIALTLKNDLFDMLTKLDGRVNQVWDEIGLIRREEIRKIFERQDALREQLPKEYLRVEGRGYSTLIEGMDRIERHFEDFAKDCREGKCGGKKS